MKTALRVSLVVGLITATALSGGSSARAARPASPTEADQVGATYHALPGCSSVTISTVDGHYAHWSLVGGPGCGFTDPRINYEYSILVARQDSAGAWRDYYQSSDPSDTCEAGSIPGAIGVDLKVCRAATRESYIPYFDSFKVRPKILAQGAHGAYENLRWRSWGAPKATAIGHLVYSDHYSHFTRTVKVTLGRVGWCGTRTSYTLMTVAAVHVRDRKRLRFATGRRDLDCPPTGG